MMRINIATFENLIDEAITIYNVDKEEIIIWLKNLWFKKQGNMWIFKPNKDELTYVAQKMLNLLLGYDRLFYKFPYSEKGIYEVPCDNFTQKMDDLLWQKWLSRGNNPKESEKYWDYKKRRDDAFKYILPNIEIDVFHRVFMHFGDIMKAYGKKFDKDFIDEVEKYRLYQIQNGPWYRMKSGRTFNRYQNANAENASKLFHELANVSVYEYDNDMMILNKYNYEFPKTAQPYKNPYLKKDIYWPETCFETYQIIE